MRESAATLQGLEGLLARLLGFGTWSCCAVVAAGTLAALLGFQSSGARIATAGIGLLICLPILRVLAMLAAFWRAGDRRFSLICALVVATILAGIVLGVWFRA